MWIQHCKCKPRRLRIYLQQMKVTNELKCCLRYKNGDKVVIHAPQLVEGYSEPIINKRFNFSSNRWQGTSHTSNWQNTSILCHRFLDYIFLIQKQNEDHMTQHLGYQFFLHNSCLKPKPTWQWLRVRLILLLTISTTIIRAEDAVSWLRVWFLINLILTILFKSLNSCLSPNFFSRKLAENKSKTYIEFCLLSVISYPTKAEHRKTWFLNDKISMNWSAGNQEDECWDRWAIATLSGTFII